MFSIDRRKSGVGIFSNKKSRCRLLIIKVLPTLKSFPRREILELCRAENHPLIAPSRHVLLPHRYFIHLTEWITIRLCVGIYGASMLCFSELQQFFMPIVYPVITLLKVVITAYHSVQEIFALESIRVYHFNSFLAMLYLCGGIAAESYPIV